MKNLILLNLALLIILSCTTKTSDFPIGAWKQHSSEIYTDDTLTEKDLITDNNMKMFSEKNWEFILKSTTDSLTTYYCGGGTYILNGKDYAETIEMHYFKDYEGKTLNMTLELKNDTLIQTWNPLDSTGMIDTHLRYVDKYIHLN
jgi:hypothetical protein